MCDRYVLRGSDPARAIRDAMPMLPFEEFDGKQIVPRFNIAPSQSVPIVRV